PREPQAFPTRRSSDLQTEGRNQHFVAGRLVVEMEAARFAPNLIKVLFKSLGLLWRHRPFAFSHLRNMLVRRAQRVDPEGVLDIGDNQLLVLLFMVGAQLRGGQHVFGKSGSSQQLVHVLIHIAAVSLYFLQRGTGKRVAQCFLGLRAYGVVVGVKEVPKLRMEWTVAFQMSRKQKSFKEPTGMRQVPFGRAGFRAGLHHLVFRAERRYQGFSLLADCFVLSKERFCRWLLFLYRRRGTEGKDRLKRRHKLTSWGSEFRHQIVRSSRQNCTFKNTCRTARLRPAILRCRFFGLCSPRGGARRAERKRGNSGSYGNFGNLQFFDLMYRQNVLSSSRIIFHVDMDAFFVSVEELSNP